MKRKIKYRIVEYVNGNNESFFEVFYRRRFLFWSTWKIVYYWIDKTFVTTTFSTKSEAEKYIERLIKQQEKEQLKSVKYKKTCVES